MPLPTLLNLKAITGIVDTCQDLFLESYLSGIMDLLTEETGLDWSDFGANKTQVFDYSVLCNTVFPINCWSLITKVEHKQNGGAWTELVLDQDYELGRLRNRPNVIFEIRQNCCSTCKFNDCSRLRITGTKGFDPIPSSLKMLLSELVRSAYNFNEVNGQIASSESSGNLKVKFDENANLLNSLKIYSPQLLPELQAIIKLYKVNYNYPL